MARWYCEQLVAGRVPHCSWERMAVERYLDMLKQASTAVCQFAFSIDHAVDACDFLEKLPHVKGFDGTLELQPVQCWWVCGIFGFRERSTGYRWVRQVSLYIPRKNGKSLLLSGIALYCATCEGEVGAEIVISAGSEEQAQKVYQPIRDMLKMEPDLRQQYRASDTQKRIDFAATGAYIIPVATIAKNLDGFNPHVVVAEELHAQKQEVIGVLATAQGARKQPLFASISTAGRQADGPAWEDWRQCQAVLQGRLAATRLFCVVYAPDKEDEGQHFDEALIEKLNPLYGVSLNAASLETEKRRARQSEADLNEYKRTRLNIWSRAAGNLFSREQWDLCADPGLDLDAFRGFPMYVGIDLASRSDLAAAVFMVAVDDCLYVVARYWLGRNVPRMKDDRFADSFFKWSQDGYLTLTDAHDGTFIDFDAILHEVLEMLKGHNVIGIAVDDYQANHIASDFEKKGHAVYIVKKNAKALTRATDDLIARHANPKLLQHDGNPVTSWCAGNVVGHYDANSNVLPKKEKPGSKANIDGMDAAILANAIRLDDEAGVLGIPEDERDVNPYLTRGLAGAA